MHGVFAHDTRSFTIRCFPSCLIHCLTIVPDAVLIPSRETDMGFTWRHITVCSMVQADTNAVHSLSSVAVKRTLQW